MKSKGLLLILLMLLSFSVCSQSVTLSERTARLVLKDLVELDSCGEVIHIQDSIIEHYESLTGDLETAIILYENSLYNDSIMFRHYKSNQAIYESQLKYASKETTTWKIVSGAAVVLLVLSLVL